MERFKLEILQKSYPKAKTYMYMQKINFQIFYRNLMYIWYIRNGKTTLQ